MNNKLIAILILVSASIIFLILSFIFYLKDRSIKRNSTNKTVGKVVSYSYHQSRAPVVEYTVNKIMYKKSLKYNYVSYLSTPFSPIRSYSKDDLLDTKLRIRNNSNLSLNTLMSDRFPIGSKLSVYYNPVRPNEAFVERFSSDNMWIVFLISAIIMVLLNFLIICIL